MVVPLHREALAAARVDLQGLAVYPHDVAQLVAGNEVALVAAKGDAGRLAERYVAQVAAAAVPEHHGVAFGGGAGDAVGAGGYAGGVAVAG